MAAIAVAKSPAVSSSMALASWRENFAVDRRALVVLRIGVAVMLLIDLLQRSFDLTAHYTDAGVLPRSARLALTWDYNEPWWMSLHMLHGSWAWNAILFALAAVAAVALLIGYRTRLALTVSWLLLVSLHGRFPLLLQGGDVLLRCLLFWLMFVPLELPARGKSSEKHESLEVVSLGTVALLSQLLIMYVFTALLKTSPLWTHNFHATYYALHIDHFTRPWSYALLEYPLLLQGMTAAAWYLELVGPLVLLVPWGQRWLRCAVPLMFIGFHLGLACCLNLGTFPWICMVYWSVFLPTWVWDRLAKFVFREKTASEKIPAEIRPDSTALIINACAAFFLAYVLAMNCVRLYHPAATVGRFPFNLLGKATGLEQYWNMFSPGPYEYGGWVQVEGILADGSRVNLWQPNEPLHHAKPTNVSGMYTTQYWRRCFVTAYEFEEPAQQTALLHYFADRWNRTHRAEHQVVTAELVHWVCPTPAPYAKTTSAAERRLLRAIAGKDAGANTSSQ